MYEMPKDEPIRVAGNLRRNKLLASCDMCKWEKVKNNWSSQTTVLANVTQLCYMAAIWNTIEAQVLYLFHGIIMTKQ